MANPCVALCQLRPNEEGTVVTLDGGYGFVSRLTALGFTPGATVSMVRNHGHGPLIVSLLDTQIALGRGEASRVQVKPRIVQDERRVCKGHRHHAR